MNVHAVRDQTLWRDDKWLCCAQPLWRGLAMNVHVVRNPTLWHGHTPRYGMVINSHDAHYLYAMLR